MVVLAYATSNSVSANLLYLNGLPPGNAKISPTNPERKHDSCYYEIRNGATESQIGLLNKTSGVTAGAGARIFV